MSTARRWQNVKAEAHRRHPDMADPQRQARARTQLDAYEAGYHLGQLRKSRLFCGAHSHATLTLQSPTLATTSTVPPRAVM